jgi:hypothetical protein
MLFVLVMEVVNAMILAADRRGVLQPVADVGCGIRGG